FRQRHHSGSGPAFVGGGFRRQPGEISLGHIGVVLLDEVPEFDRGVLVVVRVRLVSGHFVFSRARDGVSFPSLFQLVAAMYTCPFG
ncbi:ATP-binding protein, partial [Pseudomonas syringae pv. tagetis]|uniref:ATP-binding protein n=1 Tax=Pseudomonas syringae group genomosp. 7 TaxID=251699 RepID=UPI00376F5EC7